MSGTVSDSGEIVGAGAARARSFLVLAFECDRPLAGGARFTLADGGRMTIGRGDARVGTRGEGGDDRVLDLRVPAAAMSVAHARLLPVGRDWTVEDLGSTNGTFVNGVRTTRAILADGDLVTLGRTVFRFVAARLTRDEVPLDLDGGLDAVAFPSGRQHQTLDPTLDDRLSALSWIATSPISVLVRGESGTGKELVARTVHERSKRSGAFVPVNCGAIPAGLVESQLFGHLKGAFSGALRDEPGYFRASERGTIFLDEIADLPLPSQAALLRVLQEREVVAVGGTKATKVDLRVVAATHQPLETMVEEGTFRRDLLARLAGFTMELPPLRARPFDVGTIAATLLRSITGQRAGEPAVSLRITVAAAEALLRYDWPLNVRELEQCLGRAFALAPNGVIDVDQLPSAIVMPRAVAVAASSPSGSLSERDARIRRELVDRLAEHRGNLAEVARVMGKARMQIHRWCQRFGIDPNQYRG